MTAKEMFEALGYKQEKNCKYISYKNERQFQDDRVVVTLALKSITTYSYDELGEMKLLPITVELYEAIAQQMKELGWIK